MRLCHNSEMDGDGASSDDNHIIMLTIVYVLTKKKIRLENKYSMFSEISGLERLRIKILVLLPHHHLRLPPPLQPKLVVRAEYKCIFLQFFSPR